MRGHYKFEKDTEGYLGHAVFSRGRTMLEKVSE